MPTRLNRIILMKLQTLFPLVLGIAGIAIGIFLGRGPLAPPSKSSAGGQPPTQHSGSILDGSPFTGGPGRSTLSAPGGGSPVPGATGGKTTSPVAHALLGVINDPRGQAAVHRFYQTLGNMPSSDVAQLIIDVDSYPNHPRRRETREMIIDYLTMADPVKALEVRKTLPNKGIFSKALKQLGRTDPEQALLLRATMENSGDRSSALTSIFVGASEVDPARAFQLLRETPDANPQHYHEVFDNWAEMDPATAAQMALTVEKPAERREALKIVGQEWAERDPQAVLDWIGQTDLTSYEREIIRNSAIKAYAERDAKAAMDLLAGLDATIRNRALPGVVRELVKADPEAAVAWLRREPDSFSKYRAINEMSSALADNAPETAIELAKEIPEIKDNALNAAFSTLASRDVDLALQKAQEWEGDPQYADIMNQIVSGYGRENPEQALSWANQLDGDIRSSAIRSVIGRLADKDPSLAVKHLDDLGLAQDDPIYHRSISTIARDWAHHDPVTAAEWLDTLPDADWRNSAVGDIADQWARIDLVSASEWIASLTEGPGRDQAARRLVYRIRDEDPEMAAAWAASIGDESTRNNALRGVFSQWRRMDPAGAQAAIDASPLPDEWKERFRTQGDTTLRGGDLPRGR